MAEEEVGLRLSLKNRRETAAGIDDVGDKLDRAGDEAAALGRKSRIGAAGIVSLSKGGKLASRAMVTGFGAASAAVVGTGIVLTGLAKNSIAEAREAQKVGRTTAQIVKSTGGVANVSAKYLGRYSGRLSEMVGLDDELIQSSGNLLLTFKQVRNEQGKGNKVFDQALGLAVDLSAAGFGSVEGSAKMLGKALNDPIKGISALGRAGVTFTEDQKATIASLVESNRTLDAQKMILGEVQSQVGGVAKAQATFGDRASVVWGNLQERLGTALLPLLDRFQRWFVETGGPALDRYIGIFEKRGVPALKRFANRAQELGEKYLPKVQSTLADVRDVIGPVAGFARDTVDAFLDMPGWARKAIIGGGLAAGVGAKLGLPKLLTRGGGDGPLAGISKAAPLPVYVVNNAGGGLPGAGGGTKPGSAPVAGGSPKSGPRLPGTGGILSLLGYAGLSAGVTVASKDGIVPKEWKGEVQDATAFAQARLRDTQLQVNKLHDNWSAGLGEIKGRLREVKLPRELVTDIVVHGVPKSARDVRELAKTYDLTKPQRRTLFETYGIPKAKQDTSELITKLSGVPRTVPSTVDLDTSTATSRLASLQSMIRSLPGADIFLPSGSGGGGGGGGGRSRPSSPKIRIPAAPKADAGSLLSIDDDWSSTDDDGYAPTAPVEVPINIDGREVGRVSFDYLQQLQARR